MSITSRDHSGGESIVKQLHKPDETDRRPVRCRIPLQGNSHIPDTHLTLFPERRTGSFFPLEMLILATILREYGYHVTLQDDNQITPGNFWAKKKETVIIFASLFQEEAVRRTIAEETHPESQLILAGPLARLSSKEYWPDVDILLDGEPETVLEKFFTSPQSSSLSGILSSVPPDYPAIPDRSRLKNTYELIPLELGRGCRFDCSFCPTPHLYPGPRRMKPISLLQEEVKQLQQIQLSGLIQVRDDDLLDEPETAREFFRLMDESTIPFIGKARLDSLLGYGPENLPSTLKSLNVVIRERPEDEINPQMIRECFQRLIRARIRSELTILAGFPMDTRESLEIILNCLVDLPVAKYCLIPVTPLPGISSPLTGRDPDREELLEQVFKQTRFSKMDWEWFLTSAEKTLKTTALNAIKRSML